MTDRKQINAAHLTIPTDKLAKRGRKAANIVSFWLTRKQVEVDEVLFHAPGDIGEAGSNAVLVLAHKEGEAHERFNGKVDKDEQAFLRKRLAAKGFRIKRHSADMSAIYPAC